MNYPEDFGTSDFVSELTVYRVAQWGGFHCELVGNDDPREGTLLIRALAWTGNQPRLVLTRGHNGFDDWSKLLALAPAAEYRTRFVGSAKAARNAHDQWLTHAPSKLLG